MQTSHFGVVRTGDTLEGPALNCVQTLESIPLTKKRSTTHHFALYACQLVKLNKLVSWQPTWQAAGPQMTFRARGLGSRSSRMWPCYDGNHGFGSRARHEHVMALGDRKLCVLLVEHCDSSPIE